MLLLYNLIFPLVMVVYLPVFIYRQVRRGNFLPHFGERFGVYATSQRAAIKRLRAPVWVHAVSVGEVVAALSFIRRWRQRQPDLDFVLSTTTTTGRATAETRLPERVRLVYCPLDLPFTVRQALRLIRPRMLVIFEVEIWPNLVALAARAGAKVVLVNGRVSDKSARGYRRLRWLSASLFRRFSLFCMQDEEDAERIRTILGPDAPVRVCNTMKFDQIPDADVGDRQALLNEVFGPGERVVWTAGSTHAGEEALIADVFLRLKAAFPALKLILVPRHHERTAEVEAALAARRLTYRLLRPAGNAAAAGSPVDALLVNTTGELMSFYAACDLAFVGKSLAGNRGGHNIIEPAIFAKPVICGSNMDNFRRVAAAFRRAGALVEAATDADLEPALRRLLADRNTRLDLGRRAREVVDKGRGAVDRTLDQLEPLL